ncbi:MAG: agmatine deiminase family protein [Bryobacteraceae bacterium]|nr:agmatine deiminase family protein [Bryobacterales bacterium]MEB2363049.1 agmatine deiminase family protein [Bryobacterales bacterium]NUN01939.1 agmatine deiminase family protein [Bryobacteraceae bacterium]
MARLNQRTPAALGYRMPAEWELHEATWIAWPHERSDWPGKFAPVPWIYCDIVRHLARFEKVRILIASEKAEWQASRMLERSGANLDAVEFLRFETDRSWCRDYCPIFVKNRAGDVAITDWRFNGWAKYDNWTRDDQAPEAIAEKLGMTLFQPVSKGRRVVLEGGSIDVNGAGLLLTTEECLLSEVQSRNPGTGRAGMERILTAHLGIRKVLWLKNGIAGDDTHGHVDDLARFVNPTTVVAVSENNREDANYANLRENLELLRGMKDEEGRPLKIIKLPMPAPVWFDGQRLPASYANFYIANGIVLVPVFNDPNDRIALNTLARLFPDREVTGIYSRDLVLGLGTLHCLTQQQPAAGALL